MQVESVLRELIEAGFVCNENGSEGQLFTMNEGYPPLNKSSSKSRQRKMKRLIRLSSGLRLDEDEAASADIAELCIGTHKAIADVISNDSALKFSCENDWQFFTSEQIPNFIRITYHIMQALVGEHTCAADRTAQAVPVSEVYIMQLAGKIAVSSKHVARVLLHLVQTAIIQPVSEHSPRQFVFCRAAAPVYPLSSPHSANCSPLLAAAGAIAAADCAAPMDAGGATAAAALHPHAHVAPHPEDLSLDARLRWDGQRGHLLHHAVFFVPIGSSADLQEDGDCGSCLEFADKYKAQDFLGQIIRQLHELLQIPFFTAAKELIACHGDYCRVILKLLHCSTHDAVYGTCSAPQSASAEPPQSRAEQLLHSPVNRVCAVCFAENDDECILIHLPCGDTMCEDCFAARFLNAEFGALPESETPCAQPAASDDSGTPKAPPDFFTCPLCESELSPAFWDTFPQHFTHAQRSEYCKPQLTLSDIHSRIVASTLRQLRCDRFAPIARCNDASSASCGRYAFAFGGCSQQVACFGRVFDSIIDARTVSLDCSAPPLGGVSEVQAEMWTKIQLDVKTFDNRTRKLNRAGHRMVLQGSRYYCKMRYSRSDQSAGSAKECGPSQGQCLDCAFTAAELAKEAQEVKPVFVADSERGNRETDFRMCPR